MSSNAGARHLGIAWQDQFRVLPDFEKGVLIAAPASPLNVGAAKEQPFSRMLIVEPVLTGAARQCTPLGISSLIVQMYCASLACVLQCVTSVACVLQCVTCVAWLDILRADNGHRSPYWCCARLRVQGLFPGLLECKLRIIYRMAVPVYQALSHDISSFLTTFPFI